MIIDTTLNLLSHKSIEKISVKEILDICELSKGTFYKYFEDKYDIVNQYYAQHFYNALNKFSSDNFTASKEIYQFYFSHKKIIKNTIAYTGKNNLFDFTFDLLYDFYSRTWMHANKATELPVDVHISLVYHCNGMISLYREIVLSKSNYDVEYIVSIAMEMQPEIMIPFLTANNFPTQYKESHQEH